ncbi:MAG: hypothetical protein RL156_1580 [Bacteroidota bacterium]
MRRRRSSDSARTLRCVLYFQSLQRFFASHLFSGSLLPVSAAATSYTPIQPQTIQCAMVGHIYYLCYVRAYSVPPSYVEEMLMRIHHRPGPTRRREASRLHSPFSYRISRPTTGCSETFFMWIADARCDTSPHGRDPMYSCPQRHDVTLPPHITLMFLKELRHSVAPIARSRRK